ncbi:TPA: flavin reductase family protein [Methanosarcina acetivorans]|uniref:Flavoredoxin n=2 Tax=Methanosarcina acetivorans TaxID=2214 RepID=Q8TTU7_METAC|nr:flavin reductase family protein [Methanosarcina acetivorans]AAM03781.1 flavoredoxin [Methanosarcina acetivorans C2A]HIH95234.1 flavin reductase family protein [Methanosarcina acetivorans]
MAEKIKINNNVFIYPMPVTLLGANVKGKANLMALGWVSRVNANPPMLGVGVNKSHYTPEGIAENGSFSVNFPYSGMVKKTDYCGLVSGEKVDKSGLFEVFYGELKTAPMIKECTLNLECRVVETLEFPTNYFFVGEIIAAYSEEQYLIQGKPDIKKMDPLLLTMPDNSYWTVGDYAGAALKTGKSLMEKR